MRGFQLYFNMLRLTYAWVASDRQEPLARRLSARSC